MSPPALPPTAPTRRKTSSTPPPAPRRVPGWVRAASLVAILVGCALFALTLSRLDAASTLAYARRLGLALPLVLAPSVLWHLLRTWGWAVAFPTGTRPSFTRLFRVRLAADAISFFTVRGPTGEPLKVLLLADRVSAATTTASIAAERLAFALVSMAVAGVVAQFAVQRLHLSAAWDITFTLLSIAVVFGIGAFSLIARRGSGAYVGRLVARERRSGEARGRRASRVVVFMLEVETHLLALLRGARQRLVVLTVLPIVCYALNAFEVWLVFAVIGEPISATSALVIETFVRLASVAGAAVPAGIGTLEASHMAVAAALGLSGGGALALARRLRALLWAGLGLALYPRFGPTEPAGSWSNR
ncbi:MAG TPA: flippase-like domain-containing protein [Vicinamibacterales bacterium]